MTFRFHCRKGLIAALFIIWSSAPAGTSADADADGLPDEWELQYGLDPSQATGANGAAGDPDQDGATNEQELQLGTHPRGFFTRTFAEGATGAFFDTRFAVFNPDETRSSRVLVRHFTTAGPVVPQVLLMPARTRITIDPEQLQGLADTAFSTEITSDTLVVADRTMRWDAMGYGSHAETGVAGASTTWYFAEGATHSGFDLFFLMQNPSNRTVRVDVTYLLSAGAPVERRYSLAPNSRFNIWVNREDPRLAAAEVSAVFLSDTPIVVERAMYLTQHGRLFDAGPCQRGVVPSRGRRGDGSWRRGPQATSSICSSSSATLKRSRPTSASPTCCPTAARSSRRARWRPRAGRRSGSTTRTRGWPQRRCPLWSNRPTARPSS